MKKLFLTVTMLFSMTFYLTGCGSPHMEGVILEVSDNNVLLSENLTVDEYDVLKDESPTTLQNEDVHGERESLGLMSLTYDKAEAFQAGDEVGVWIKGDIADSYPGQATAKKMELKQ